MLLLYDAYINQNNRVFILLLQNELCRSPAGRAKTLTIRSWRTPFGSRRSSGMANSYRHSCPSAQTSNRLSDNGRDDYRPKYQLSEVDHCGLHGGHGGYLSLVVSWLQRAFCCHREVGGPTDPRPAQVRFPKKLVVFVERDRNGNVYAVLETPSSSLPPKTHVRGKLRNSDCCSGES